jgi:cbb3-type cytochrome oxidase subunit 3
VIAGLVTLFALLAFVAIVVWVFIVKKKEDFDEQAALPLDDGDRNKENKEKSS